MKRVAIAAVIALAMMSTAQAQNAQKAQKAQNAPKAHTSPLYGEIGLSLLNLDLDGSGGDVTALRGVVGYDLHDVVPLPPNVPVKLAAEGILALGITEASESESFNAGFGYTGETTAKTKLKYSLGGYAKGTFNVTPELEVFGRLGIAQTKVTATATTTVTYFGSMSASASNTDTGLAYGLGAKYNFNPRMSVGIDYMQYADGVDGFTASFGYRF